MKKLIWILPLIVLASCKKEQEEDEQCNCGIITDDGTSTNFDGTTCYWLEVRNNCTNNKKTWCFDYDVWFDGNLGEEFCVTNVTSW